MTYEVITIGGATLDIFLDIHESSQHCCVKQDESGEWLCLKRGEKIPVDFLHYDVGGNAANVAVGLSRLGVKAAAYVHYGSDEISQKIVTTLQNEGVGTEFAVVDEHETSSIGIAINFQGERNLLVHHIVRNHTLPQISVPKWLYLTSVGEKWEELYRQVVAFVKSQDVKLAFNPGSHQMESGVESFMEQVRASDVLFVNKEEGEKIAGGNTGGSDMKQLLTQLQSLGPKVVSVTDGENGAYAIDETGVYHIERFPQESLERTGAGDAYASGFLAALAHNEPVVEAMRWGSVNAAHVIAVVGAEKGLLKKEEMEKKLAKYPEFKAEII